LSVSPSNITEAQSRFFGQPLELAVVVPTFKESANVEPLLKLLQTALQGVDYEVIFVDDDSPDQTAALIRNLARINPRVRVLQRIGRRGLSSACIEGMLATPARYIAVMDADLQHDERILPQMLQLLKRDELDLVIGSRNVEGGSMGQFARQRVLLSGLGARLSRMVCHCTLSDPMSGFFIVDRRFFEEVVHRLSALGFKILVDLVSSCRRPVRFGEVPYKFRSRQAGESKLDLNVGLEYISLLLDKLIGDVIPVRFVLFGFVGALGLVVHLATLGLLTFKGGVGFVPAQAAATIVAMTFNFLLNNIVTFRDRRLRGWRIVPGLISYYIACSLGALANLSLAKLLITGGFPWYVAGACGMIVSSVWNYGVNTIFTWRRGRYKLGTNSLPV
jgi:dolichol-phosphate mannosyltransferase